MTAHMTTQVNCEGHHFKARLLKQKCENWH